VTWQLYVLLPLVVLWIIGGGLMVGVSIRRQTASRRFHPAQGIVATLLATMAGIFGVFITMYVFLKLGSIARGSSEGMLKFLIAGGIVGVIVALLVMFTVYYAMFKASARQVVKAMLPPSLGILLLTGIAGGLMIKPTIAGTNDRRSLDPCGKQIINICGVLQTFGNEAPPATIEGVIDALKRKGLGDVSAIFTCPGKSKEPIGYVYLAYDPRKTGDAPRLVLADRKTNHLSTVNAVEITVTSTDGKLKQEFHNRSWTRAEFEKRLAAPENEAFAAVYNK